MYNPLSKEVWKVYPLNYEFEGNNHLEISNLGRVKSFNKFHPDGNIIRGSLQGGFPIIRLRLYQKRTSDEIQMINEVQKAIDDLNAKIKLLGKKDKESAELSKLRSNRDAEIQKRKKINTHINKERALNIGFLVHKMVAELFLEVPQNNSQTFVIHKDFDKKNNVFTNLEYADQQTLTERSDSHPNNVAYNFKKEFLEPALRVKNSKLKDSEVLFIKKRLKKGVCNKKLAKRFGISEMQIHRIKTGENWNHVQLVEDLLEKRKKKWQAT
ncbi:hypothetical protein RCH13_000466 [Chryseobacterium sp. MP_3.2]|nr:hypothetical protein [Chryseobacterium sp. MP_3.2]